MNYLELSQLINELEKMSSQGLVFFYSHCEDFKLQKYVMTLLKKRMDLELKEFKKDMKDWREQFKKEAIKRFLS